MQIKLDILDGSKLFQNKEFQVVRTQIREVELTKAYRLRSMARVKWLGTGDKPYALFFALLKEKGKRENMAILITKNVNTLVEDGEILQEVTRFYGKLFQSLGFNKATRVARREIL